MLIVDMRFEHWSEVSRIYQEGINTGVATFETELPDYKTWNSSHLDFCRRVAFVSDELAGWIALSPVSDRCVYGGVAELSVYVAKAFRGMGVGQYLMASIIPQSEGEGIWTLQSGVFPENLASRKLHIKMGFREIGYRESIGQINGVWKDNILFERRSKLVGV